MATVQEYNRYNTEIFLDQSTLAEHIDTDVAGASIGDLMYLNSTAEWEKTAGLLKWDGLQLRISGDLVLQEKAAPATPASGFGAFYAGTDGSPHYINDAGASTNIGFPTATVVGAITNWTGSVWQSTEADVRVLIGASPSVRIDGDAGGEPLTMYLIAGALKGYVGFSDIHTGLQIFTVGEDIIFNPVSASIPSFSVMSTGHLRVREYAAPGTPAASFGYVYAKTDSKLYFKNDAGAEFDLTNTGGSGNVTKVGTPLNNQIGVWTGDGTIEGDANFTWTGTSLGITGSLTVSSFITAGGDVDITHTLSNAIYSNYGNSTTGGGVSNGLGVGIDASENAVFRNRELTDNIFYTNDIERMRISSGGNFTIGTGTGEVTIAASGGKVAFFGGSSVIKPTAYTMNTVVVTDKTLLASASATTLNNNNVLAALITDLQALNLIG